MRGEKSARLRGECKAEGRVLFCEGWLGLVRFENLRCYKYSGQWCGKSWSVLIVMGRNQHECIPGHEEQIRIDLGSGNSRK